MNETDVNVVFRFEMLRQMLGTIDRTMLTACATERDLQMFKTAFDKALHMMINETIDRIQECKNLAVLLEKINHRLIQSRQGFILLIFAGVMSRAAVKDITATVAGFVGRNAAFKGEGVNRY